MILYPSKRKLIPVSLYLLFVSISISATAQKNLIDGYIVKRDGDSLRGQIDYRDWGANPSYIDFFEKGSGKSVEFSAEDLRAFGVNADRYESHRVRIYPYVLHPETLTSQQEIPAPFDTTVFLQVVTAGRMSLWEYRQSNGLNYFFVSGEAGRPDQLRMITRITNDNGDISFEQLPAFRDQLIGRMSDCDAVQSRIRKSDYDEASLRKLVFSYNNCGKDVLPPAPATPHSGAIRLFPFAGFVSSKVNFAGGSDPTAQQHYPSSNGVTAGIGALIVLPRYREQFSFVVDVGWQHIQSVSDSGQESTYINAVGHLDYSIIMLETLFRYSYPTEKVRPFIEAGMANGTDFGLNCYQTAYNHLYNPPQVYKDQMLGGGFRRFQSGWILGVGVGARHWSLEGRFERNNGISNLLSISSATTSASVLLAYYL